MKKQRPLIAAIAVALALAGCANGDGTTSSESAAAAEGTSAAGAVATTAADSTTETTASEATSTATEENAAANVSSEDYVWDEGDVVEIGLGDTIDVDSSVVAVSGSTITITGDGTYQLSGTLSDGEVIVNAGDNALVQLILNGVDITNSDGAAISILNADRAAVILADGSANTLTDGSTYVLAEGEDEPNATLYSKTDLSISGEGSLTINANYNDGIGAKDGLVIDSGDITVNAVDDGIRGKDYIVVNGGVIDVTSGGDGLKSDNEEDATKGYIEINTGSITVNAGGDAISAETDVLISDGDFDLTTSGSGTTSAKGIKGLVSVVIDGGTFTIDTSDDGVHSNGTITITGGDFEIATGDDGMHADTSLEVNNATILITDCYEGLESALITINSGDIEIHADDDGINVAGGQDGTGMQRGPGRGGGPDAFSFNSDYQLIINGGTIVIYAQGDGLDSNGIATMTGGVAVVHGPTGNGNGALDAGSFDVTGGLLIAVGSAGMAEGVTSSTGQASLQAVLNGTQAGGTLIHIESDSGESVLTFESSKDFASIVFTSPDLASGTTYNVYFGGTAGGDDVGGLYSADDYSGGELVGSLTAS